MWHQISLFHHILWKDMDWAYIYIWQKFVNLRLICFSKARFDMTRCIFYRNHNLKVYEGCSKWIAYFYLETSNFKLAQKYSFHSLEVLPVARNAKFQPMYPLLEGVTVRWFGHSNKVLMNGRSKCLSGLVFPPSKECFQFRKQKEITWGKVWGIRGVRQNSYLFFLQKRRNYCRGMSWVIVM